MKEEHVILADYSYLFTKEFLKLATRSLENPKYEKPTFMHKVPGIFQSVKGKLVYVDTLGIRRVIVPKEKRELFLKLLWAVPTVPRGQESFQKYISKRYIGLQTKLIRDFVAKQTGMQMVRALKNTDNKRRAIRALVPFTHISFDLADMISFSEVRGTDEPRFLLCVCDDFSGFLFVKRIINKSGLVVAKKLRVILDRITKMKGKMRIATSDLGKEFLNQHVQGLLKEYGIKHLQPKTGARIAPYIENRIGTFKRYLRLLSKMLFKDTAWHEPETIRNATSSVNNITRKSGYSAKEIVKMWLNGQNLEKIRDSYQEDEQKDEKILGFSNLKKGDFVRIRVAKQKLGLDHKSHLGFKGDYFDQPVNWGNEVYHIVDKKRLRVRRTQRFLLNNKLWYNRTDLLKVPEAKKYNPDDRMPRVNKKTFEKKKYEPEPEPKQKKKVSKKINLNVGTENIVRGRRRRKRINYAE